MKKIGIVVIILMLAAPVWARVDIKCTADGNVVTVKYAVVGQPNKVSGFGLDITVDSRAKIKSIDVNSLNPYYWAYPGSIVIDTATGQVTDYGSPVADPNFPGTLPGLDTNGITIEMSALYWPTGDNSPNAPNWNGDLLKFRVDKDCCVTVKENLTRGIVLTRPNLASDVNATGCCVRTAECLPNTVPYYDEWVKMGKPQCWCYPRQCYGDADGRMEGSLKTGYYYVHFNDLHVLLAGWNVREPATPPIPSGPGIVTVTAPNGVPCVCADFGHDQEGGLKSGYYRVHFNDLNQLLRYWNTQEPPAGKGVPPNCSGDIPP